MNREEFLNELEKLLSDISETEKAEALQYYREYFEDANMPDGEVIKQLGSVSSVAESIREELADKELVAYKPNEEPKSVDGDTGHEKERDNYEQMHEETITGKKQDKDTGLVVLLVVLGILGSPFIVGAFVLVLGVLLAVICVLLGIVLTSATCVVAFGSGAVASLIAMVVKLIASPLVAILFLGMCLLFTGLCFLSIFITWKMCVCVLPGFFIGLGKMVTTPFRKKKVEIA